MEQKYFVIISILVLGLTTPMSFAKKDLVCHNYKDYKTGQYTQSRLDEAKTLLSKNLKKTGTEPFSGNPITSLRLYTKSLPKGQIVTVDNIGATKAYNSKQNLVVLMHDYAELESSTSIQTLKDAIIARDISVVSVNYEELTTKTYATCRERIDEVADYTAEFINYINTNRGHSLKNIAIVGNGLGSHVGSLTAKLMNGKPRNLIALDPSTSMFNPYDTTETLCTTDAENVQTIVTSVYGLHEPVGTINYYMNGMGKLQPGCTADDRNDCSHRAAIKILTNTIKNPTLYKAYQYTNYWDVANGRLTKTGKQGAFVTLFPSTTLTGVYGCDTAAL